MVIDSTFIGVASFYIDGKVCIPDTAVRIEQLGSGRVFIYVEECTGIHKLNFQAGTISLSGTVASGHRLEIPSIRYMGRCDNKHCYRALQGSIGSLRKRFEAVQMRITNTRFRTPGTHTLTIGEPQSVVYLNPCDRYDDRELFMRQTDLPTVTAIMMVGGGRLNRTTFSTLKTDLTMALSAVQGRKVESICDSAITANGDLVWMEFGETKTKNYSPSTFCFNPKRKRFHTVPVHGVTDCFQRVREFRNQYDPNHRILNSWFDARLEDDFLEARTLKYVVVAEALCHIVDEVSGIDNGAPVAKKHWRAAGKHFLPLLRSHLESLRDVTEEAVDLICDANSWGNLNRLSFRSRLTMTLSTLGVTIPQQSRRIEEFVAIRNKIVHQFTYMRKDDFRERKWPIRNGVEQHFIVAAFIDEVLLRLCGLEVYLPEQQKTRRAPNRKG